MLGADIHAEQSPVRVSRVRSSSLRRHSNVRLPRAPVPGHRSTMREGVGHSAASNAADVDRGEKPQRRARVSTRRSAARYGGRTAPGTRPRQLVAGELESILSGLIDTLAHRPPTQPGTCPSPPRSNSTGSDVPSLWGDGPPGRHFEPARRRDWKDGRTGLPEQDDRGQPRDQFLDRFDAPTPDVCQVRSQFSCGPGRVGARGAACLRRTPCPQALTGARPTSTVPTHDSARTAIATLPSYSDSTASVAALPGASPESTPTACWAVVGTPISSD